MKQLQRLVAYSPNGARLGPLPVPAEASFSIPLNDVSGCTVSYRDGLAGSSHLRSLIEVAAEYSLDDGLTWTEYDNGRYLRLGRSGNEISQDDLRQFQMPGYGWLLNKMRQMKTTGLNADGKRPFNSSNAGMIMKTLIDEAQARGVCTGISYDFTTSLDSNGVAWNKVLSIAYEPGLDLFTILNNLSQQGIVDWMFQGRTLRIFNADSFLGPVTSTKLQPGVDIEGMPVQGTYEDFVHTVLVLGDGGKKLPLASSGLPEPWGKWEGFIGQGGVSDTATMTILAQAQLADGNHEKRQYTAEVDVDNTTYEPMVHYRQGSYVTVPTEDGAQSFRIRQMNFSRNGEGDISLGLVINDRFVESSIRNARRVNGITGGASSGGAGTAPTKEPGARRPKKAEGLVVDSVALVNQVSGIAEAWAYFNYPAVELDVDDVALEISGYRFRARRPTYNLLTENPSFEGTYTGAQGGSATVSPSTVWKTDGLQSLRITPNGTLNGSSLYPVGYGSSLGASMVKMGVLQGKTYVISADIRVNAVQTGILDGSARRIVVGQRSTGGATSILASSTAAPNKIGQTRLALKFTVPAGGIEDIFFILMNGSSNVAETVEWDNVEILEYSTSPWGSWASWGSSSTTSHGYGPLEPGTTWQVQFAAISQTGLQGDWSDTVTFTSDIDIVPPPVPAAPTLSTRLGTVSVYWSGKDSTSVAMPKDTSLIHVYRNVVGSGSPSEVGIINNKGRSLVLTDVVIGTQYEFWFVAEDTSGNFSAAGASASITVASIMDDPEAALDIQEGVTVASGGNNNTYSPNEPSGSGSKINDKWFRIVSGSTVGVWFWDGDSWETEQYTNAVIANLDAGKITSGTIAAARIASGTITTDMLDSGAVNGIVITGSTIQTSASGARIVLSHSPSYLTIGNRNGSSEAAGMTGWYFDGVNGACIVLDSTSTRMFVVNPAGNYIRVGSNTGSNGMINMETNGRLRLYNAAHALFADFDATLGSQNVKIIGAMIADSLNVGVASSGAARGIFNSDSASAYLQSTGNLHITIDAGGSGQVRCPTAADDVLTASDTIGMAIRTGTGQMGIVGSARRLKVNITDHEFTGDLLALSPRRWHDRRDMEKYAGILDGIAAGIDPTGDDELEGFDPLRPAHGLVAEEVEEAGLGEFVHRNADGEIVALAYERLWLPLIPIVRKLRNRVDELERSSKVG